MKLIFTLFKIRENIYKAMIIQTLTSEKNSLMNQNLSTLLSIEKNTITILSISSMELSIF